MYKWQAKKNNGKTKICLFLGPNQKYSEFVYSNTKFHFLEKQNYAFIVWRGTEKKF